MGWYYAVSNQRLGPVSDTEFAALAANGTITPASLVWRQGMAGWLPYAQVAGVPPQEDADSATCAVSGRRYPKTEMLQFEGRWVSAEHRDVFFQRLREGLAPAAADKMPGPFGYAGFWWRALAWIIDYIAKYVVTQIVNVVIMLAVMGSITGMQRMDPENPQIARIFLMLGLIIVFDLGILVAYNWIFLSKFQATPGKLALGLKVVRSDGSKLTTGRIIGRTFGEMINGFTLLVGYMLAGWDDEKRALHDRICDTRVIRTR
jgi:uncharacterized RDD family membrane protein YckC